MSIEAQLHVTSHIGCRSDDRRGAHNGFAGSKYAASLSGGRSGNSDADGFMRDYAPKVAGTREPYGGRFVTSGKLTALEGNVPQRFVIIGFDSVGKARGWYDSAAYQQLVPIRQKTARSTLFIAEGRP